MTYNTTGNIMYRCIHSGRSLHLHWYLGSSWVNIVSAADRIALGLLIVYLGMAVGAGAYEARAVYPGWQHDPRPDTLAQRLAASGQTRAARRFWPYLSPPGLLIAFWNLVAATTLLQRSPDFRTVAWAAIATAVVLKSVATYAYFAPTMILKFERAHRQHPDELATAVRRWVLLSPVRTWIELIALPGALCVFAGMTTS